MGLREQGYAQSGEGRARRNPAQGEQAEGAAEGGVSALAIPHRESKRTVRQWKRADHPRTRTPMRERTYTHAHTPPAVNSCDQRQRRGRPGHRHQERLAFSELFSA